MPRTADTVSKMVYFSRRRDAEIFAAHGLDIETAGSKEIRDVLTRTAPTKEGTAELHVIRLSNGRLVQVSIPIG